MKTGSEWLAANGPTIREVADYIDPEVLALALGGGEQWTQEEIERMQAIARNFFRKPD